MLLTIILVAIFVLLLVAYMRVRSNRIKRGS